jgi:hypothetical protein
MSINEMELQDQYANSFLADLLSFVEEAEVNEIELDQAKPGFQIETMEQANYITRKLKELRAEQEQIEETAKRELRRYEDKVNTWKEKTLSPLQNQEQFYMSLLESFARQKLEGSNKKSLKLIEGTIGFRKQQDKYEYDDKVLTAYLEENHKDLVKYKASPDKIALKKAGEVKNGVLYINGKAVPGVTIIPQDEKFEVK